MPAGREALTKLRILVAEDEILVAMLVEEMLQELGCEIVATVSSVAAATAAVRRNNLDGALLDVNLNGENSSPVADELIGRAVPFLLVTGYGSRAEDPPAMKTAPRLKKPFAIDELADRMLEVFVQHPLYTDGSPRQAKRCMNRSVS